VGATPLIAAPGRRPESTPVTGGKG
jgi:hypothetical protein